MCLFVILLSYLIIDGHALHLRSETVAIFRRMNMILYDYDDQMISVDENDLNFLIFVLQLRKNPSKILNRNIDPLDERQQSYIFTTGVKYTCHGRLAR